MGLNFVSFEIDCGPHIPSCYDRQRFGARQSEGYKAGADSYITKPFSINLLKSRLNNIFEARKKLETVYSSDFKSKKIFFNESTSQIDKEFLEKLNAIIEKNLEDEELNISHIASQLNMSHSTLYRKIKALTNLTANEYIRKIRINVGETIICFQSI
jgi:DNA-binding NtrC family response regulator